ncbi:TonB protein C-terminal [Salegentibacter echinorum]|uniref:TonB protein C-terminal n=1 Tax=Salegentibacter echinorum TaxID=1073325 RepID=A0A1M5LBV6_SALEC|nr:energy transducer TonB [Salegentibacter echinorum]SHG62584.1 TonB protein C-terminal [Salegentibacter echinorum]
MKKFMLITCFIIGGFATAQAQQTSPVWPGCEDAEDVKACFNQKLAQHVRKNYEYPQSEDGEYIRGKVKISFTITEEGKAVVESVEGDKAEVNAAAKAMIQKIPDMEPGTLNGEPDDRNFTVPFNF